MHLFIRVKSGQNIGIMKLGREIAEVIRKSVVSEIKEGLHYLRGQKQMRSVIDVLFLVWAGLGAAYVVFIVFIQETLGTLTQDLGLLVVFLGLGLFLGSLAYGRLGKNVNCFKTIFSSLFPAE